MNAHTVDPIALIFGLLFALTGMAIITDEVFEQVDVTAITGLGIAIVGMLLVMTLVVQQIRSSRPSDEATEQPSDEF